MNNEENMHHCKCENFEHNGNTINGDAHQCKNCLGWKSGFTIAMEKMKENKNSYI